MLLRAAATFAFIALLGGCALLPSRAPLGLIDLAERPAEGALLTGMRAYDDAQYAQAEQALTGALRAGLVSPRDRAAAHKYLAFIYCTSQRLPACEDEFRAARAEEPAFALSRAEGGHPQWGPVWQRVRQ
jgi:Tfp pilus assembly protein PilF